MAKSEWLGFVKEILSLLARLILSAACWLASFIRVSGWLKEWFLCLLEGHDLPAGWKGMNISAKCRKINIFSDAWKIMVWLECPDSVCYQAWRKYWLCLVEDNGLPVALKVMPLHFLYKIRDKSVLLGGEGVFFSQEANLFLKGSIENNIKHFVYNFCKHMTTKPLECVYIIAPTPLHPTTSLSTVSVHYTPTTTLAANSTIVYSNTLLIHSPLVMVTKGQLNFVVL